MSKISLTKIAASALIAMMSVLTTACGDLEEYSDLAGEGLADFSLRIVSGSGQKGMQNDKFAAPVSFKAIENGANVQGLMVEFKIVEAAGEKLLGRDQLAAAWNNDSLTLKNGAALTQNACGQLMNLSAESNTSGIAEAFVRAGSPGCSRSALLGRAISSDGMTTAYDFILIQSN